MADTTAIDDLPSDPHVSENKIIMEKKETPDYENMMKSAEGPSNPSVPSAIENQKMMNELVSGIQQASASGATSLPSRDIPMNAGTHQQDVQVQPNFVPTNQNDDYIMDQDNPTDYLLDNARNNKKDSLEILLENLQTPILLGVLYFIFQLPVVNKQLFRLFPAFFGKDSNPNLGGFLFISVLFALSYFLIQGLIQKIDI